MVLYFDIRIQELFNLMGGDASHDQEAKGVGDEGNEVILGEKLGVFLEDGALLGPFDVRFQGNQPVFADDVEELVEEREELEVDLFAGLVISLDGAYYLIFYSGQKLGGRGDQEGPCGRSPNNDEFGDLHQNKKGSSLEGKPTEDRPQDHHCADDNKHRPSELLKK